MKTEEINLNEDKKALRREIRLRKKEFFASTSVEERLRLSETVLNRLKSTDYYKNAKVVVCYYSLDDELATQGFCLSAAKEKTLLLPRVVGNDLSLHPFRNEGDLQVGAYGIKEPVTEEIADYSAVDLVIVPGMAFDDEGNRLGRGRGYYDRLFASKLRPEVVKIGVCFPFQMVERVPCAPFDVRMNAVFSH